MAYHSAPRPDFAPAGLARPPGRLLLLPQPVATAYAAVTAWEEFVAGTYQKTTIARHVTVGVQADADGGNVVTFRTAPPQLTKNTAVQPLEALALRLAALYSCVVVRVAPDGALRDVLNHADILHAWQGLKAALTAEAPPDDRVTAVLVAALDGQFHARANVLRSLPHDYLYRALLAPVYDDALAGECGHPPPREFPQFLANTSLWFTERRLTAPADAPAPEHVVLAYRGTVDAQRTDEAAIGRLMAAAAYPGQPPATGPAGVPHFGYAATHVLEKSTGLPVRVALTAYARLGEVYNKEYTLTIERV